MNNLDTLMDSIESILSTPAIEYGPDQINAVIAYYRRQREGGLKPKKDTGGPVPSLTELGMAAPKPTKIYRR
jgi:hypothetical protein